MIKLPTPDELLDDAINLYQYACDSQNLVVPDVTPGSDTHLLLTTFSNMLAVAYAQNVSDLENLYASTATGEDLDRHLESVGLSRLAARAATCSFILESTATVNIPVGTTLISQNGSVFTVQNPGVHQNQDRIFLLANVPGSSGNVPAQLLRWGASLPYLAQTATLTESASGGTDVETDQDARARLLAALANGVLGENSTALLNIVKQNNKYIQDVYLYDCVDGPSTLTVAVTKQPTNLNFSRTLDDQYLSEVTNSIEANSLIGKSVRVVPCNNVPTDISFSIDTTFPIGSLRNAIGNGWINQSPYPLIDNSESYCEVLFVVNPKQIKIKARSGTSPVKNLSSISFIDSEFNVKSSVISDYSVVGNEHTLFLVDSLNVSVGDFIFPTLLVCDDVLNSVIGFMKTMGPNELTTHSSVLPRALRFPLQDIQNTSRLDSNLFRRIQDENKNIYDVAYLHTTQSEPDIANDSTSIPGILVPRKIAFYPKGL